MFLTFKLVILSHNSKQVLHINYIHTQFQLNIFYLKLFGSCCLFQYLITVTTFLIQRTHNTSQSTKLAYWWVTNTQHFKTMPRLTTKKNSKEKNLKLLSGNICCCFVFRSSKLYLDAIDQKSIPTFLDI